MNDFLIYSFLSDFPSKKDVKKARQKPKAIQSKPEIQPVTEPKSAKPGKTAIIEPQMRPKITA